MQVKVHIPRGPDPITYHARTPSLISQKQIKTRTSLLCPLFEALFCAVFEVEATTSTSANLHQAASRKRLEAFPSGFVRGESLRSRPTTSTSAHLPQASSRQRLEVFRQRRVHQMARKESHRIFCNFTRHIGDFRQWATPSHYQNVFHRLLRDLKAGT